MDTIPVDEKKRRIDREGGERERRRIERGERVRKREKERGRERERERACRT